MKAIIRYYKADPVFWSVLILLFVCCGISLAAFSPKTLFFRFNAVHTLYLDVFFQNYTLLGDGVFSIAIFLILLLADKTILAIQVITGYLFSGIISQILKHLIAAPRPHAIISGAEYPYFIEGITYSGMNSFPSGHTTSVFALAVLLALNTSDKRIALIYLVAAIITGYSRIYLGQHFLADVAAGALTGTLSAVLVYRHLHRIKIEFTGVNNESQTQMQLQ